MMSVDLTALLPLIVLAAAEVVAMMVVAFARNHFLTAALTVLGLAAAALSLLLVPSASSRQVTPLLLMDDFARLYSAVIILASIAVAVLAYGYFRQQEGLREEFYLLLIMATLGAIAMAASTHFASLFLGLEVLSVSLYAMIAYQRRWERSIEAGLKYLVLAAASAAFLLFGMALVYAETGTMEFAALGRPSPVLPGLMMVAGLALIIVGIGFKLAIVPFHLWTPDVYEGAPAPTTTFVATVSKGGMFAVLLRLFNQIDLQALTSLWLVFGMLAIASMLGGNLLALMQSNVKRILAYSSIAHLGYMLVAFLAGGALGISAATFYLIAYFVTTLGSFGVVTVLSSREGDADSLEDYRGLYRRHPALALLFTAMLLSLAGMPLTVGFIGKFLLLTAGAGFAMWIMAVVLVVASAISAYYYLRVAFVMFQRPEGEPSAERAPALTAGGGLVLGLLAVLLIVLGVYPGPLLQVIQATVAALG